MIELTSSDKIELNRIFNSVQGRLDKKLIELVIDFVFKTRVSIGKDDSLLFSANMNKIPSKNIDSFSLGSIFGQIYQISLEISKKMELKLKPDQKRILREFILFIVLFKFEKEMNL